MIDIKPPDWCDSKQIQEYFIQLIIYSNTREEAFDMFCKYESSEDAIFLAREIIANHYLEIKTKEGWRLTPLGKELV